MLHKKIDVIIPVYNKSYFMHDLIFSLSKLPVEFFNIIFVDDGSTDDSYQIVDELIFNNDFDNFFIFKKSNGGVSSARNFGLKISRSEYVWFFDPDDKLCEKIISKLEFLWGIDVDVFIFSHENIRVSHQKVVKNCFYENEILPTDYFLLKYDALTGKNKNMNFVWNKWYRRSFIEGIYFDQNISYGEDRLFNLKVFTKEGCIYLSEIFSYRYFVYGEGTLSSELNISKVNDVYLVNIENIKALNKSREACKNHIISQIRDRTAIGLNDLLVFYCVEHKKMNMKILPFMCFYDFITFALVFFRLNNLFYKTIKYFREKLMW